MLQDAACSQPGGPSLQVFLCPGSVDKMRPSVDKMRPVLGTPEAPRAIPGVSHGISRACAGQNKHGLAEADMGAGASKGGAGSDIRSKFSIGAQTSKPERYAPLLSLSLSLL
jgi:hypothetical protein